MWIRILLNLTIICCSTILGNHIANSYVYRVGQLHALQISLAKLETEIIYYSTFLPEALERVGQSILGEVGDFLCDVATNLSTKADHSIESAWTLALKENRSNLKITHDDCEIMERFGSQLGTADISSQKQLFELTQMQLVKQQEKAEEDRLKYEKMYRSLGFLSGLTIVIILF